ncbi:hypothetical protein GT022_08485 [Agaribacter marinus]|uniref:Uncharacterized protein n=1 Tax=Virgibacillus salarius TaxID=447199 RepID=A0A941I9Z2_9BACI|nr:hypothetical protein [Virgibacillus salarius]MBR7796083.1 hypothetical protein [Virgibacillus salarius]NAZ08794.1 hypothetical protein [Agaribacter marinus]
MYFNFINSLLILICLVMVIYLLYRLLTWWSKYKKWIDSVEKRFEQRELNINSSGFAQGIKIPNLILKDPWDNSYIELHNLVHNDSILVFLDKSCLQCSINFEEFFNSNQKDNYFVIFKEQDVDKAKELVMLYNNSFRVYLVNQSLYKTLKLKFMPAFVKINHNYIAENATPVPYKAIHFL